MKSLVALALLAVTGCATPYGDADDERSEAAVTEPAPETKKTKKPTVPTDAAVAESTATTTANHDVNADTKAPTSSDTSAPRAALDFTWNKVSPTAEYSLDVMLANGELVGPCIGAPILGRELSLEGFTGKCTSAERTLSLDAIVDFRICYAENDDWAHCRCKLANWDGKATSITFDN